MIHFYCVVYLNVYIEEFVILKYGCIDISHSVN
jgi:hypothetical protein